MTPFIERKVAEFKKRFGVVLLNQRVQTDSDKEAQDFLTQALLEYKEEILKGLPREKDGGMCALDINGTLCAACRGIRSYNAALKEIRNIILLK